MKEDYLIYEGIAEECHPCVLKQACTSASFVNLSEKDTEDIVLVAQRALEEATRKPMVVQQIVRRVADSIIKKIEEQSDFDIYKEVKIQSNNLALKYADFFDKKISRSSKPLETGLQIAAAGNIIDFGAKSHGNIDIENELQNLENTHFERYDIDEFQETITNASTMLYLCDNSGEIVLDKIFIQLLKQKFPQLHIIAAVREKPIINDATLEDAKEVGLDNVVTTISSGSIYPGTLLSETTSEFQQMFSSVDIILAKGQGNFETLLSIADKRCFFLLKIKCDHMASFAGVEKGSLVLMQGRNCRE